MSKINKLLVEAGILDKNLEILSKLQEAPLDTLIAFKIPEGKSVASYRSSIRQEFDKSLKDNFTMSTKVIGDTIYVVKEKK